MAWRSPKTRLLETGVMRKQPNHERALTALEWATLKAEGQQPGAPPLALSVDYQLAANQYLADTRALLDRLIMATDVEAGLDALLECGALTALLPSVERMVGFSDGEWRHKDVWKHTKQVVRQAVPRIEVRWAALLHDIGKVKTRSITPDGQVHFHGHAEVGARMFDKMERRAPLFRRDVPLKKTVRFLILHHLRASHYSASWSDSAVRRFAREMGAEMDNLFCLSRADITTKRAHRKRRGLRQIDELQLRVSQLAAQDAIKPPLPKGVGMAIIEGFGIPPSKRVGNIKKRLELEVAAGRLAPFQSSDHYIDYLRAHPHLLEDEAG